MCVFIPLWRAICPVQKGNWGKVLHCKTPYTHPPWCRCRLHHQRCCVVGSWSPLMCPCRFHHYDCLVVPTNTVSDHSNFHWEKVSLLVEYEALVKPLFGGSCTQNASSTEGSMMGGQSEVLVVLDRLNLQDYFTLRAVLDLATSNLSLSSGNIHVPT